MIANSEKKDFKTITLRDMDIKPELVNIMNEVMENTGIKTGQACIEYIIKDYDRTSKLYQELLKQSEKDNKEAQKERLEYRQKIHTLETDMALVKKVFQMLAK